MTATSYDLSAAKADRDVDPTVKVKVRKNLTYLLLFAIVMAFSGLLSAYLVSKGSVDFWVSIRIPTQ